MRKKFSLFLTLVMLFTSIFISIGDYISVKASTTYNYNDVLVGIRNINNTTNNSATVGDLLVKPEKGWKRYDDKNSKIKSNGFYGYVSCGSNVDGVTSYMGQNQGVQKKRIVIYLHLQEQNLD